MADPKPLTRNQIAAFVGNDPEAIRSIERLFRVAGELTPSDIAGLSASIEDTTLAAGATQGQLEAVAAQLRQIADAAQFQALAPAIVPATRQSLGTFYDLNTQSAAIINTAYTLSLSNTDISQGVYLSGTQITVDQKGTYNFQHSIQLNKTTGGKGLFYLWYAKNGTDVAESATRVRLEGNNSEQVASWNYVFALKAGDYIEYKWAVDDLGVTITRFAAAAPVPGIPSAIVTVTNDFGS